MLVFILLFIILIRSKRFQAWVRNIMLRAKARYEKLFVTAKVIKAIPETVRAVQDTPTLLVAPDPKQEFVKLLHKVARRKDEKLIALCRDLDRKRMVSGNERVATMRQTLRAAVPESIEGIYINAVMNTIMNLESHSEEKEILEFAQILKKMACDEIEEELNA